MQTIDAALKKGPKYPEKSYPTFRYERAWNQSVVTDRLSKKTFVTEVYWSTGAGVAKDTQTAKSPRFHYKIYGKSGKDVGPIADVPGEGGLKPSEKPKNMGKGEVLFPRGLTFAISKAVPPHGPVPTYSDAADRGDPPTIDITLTEQ
jgi:hypothetical protein